MRSRIAIFLVIVQSVLLLAHLFIYETWTAFFTVPGLPGIWYLQATLTLLSVSFVTASLLAWRYSHPLVSLFYKISALWLGVLSFCFLAACSCWVVYDTARMFRLHLERRHLAMALFGSALLVSCYGVVNAAWTRVRRVSVKLPNLPASWRGRVAALVSDTHLGHVRGYWFMRRLVAMLTRLRPDIVFIGGDMYDGTADDNYRLADP